MGLAICRIFKGRAKLKPSGSSDTPKNWMSRELGFYLCFFATLMLTLFAMRIVTGPFVLALVLAYIFNPWIEALEKRGVPRWLVVGLAINLVLLAVTMIGWFLVPILIHQAEVLIQLAPVVGSYVQTKWLPGIYHALGSLLPQAGSEAVPKLSDIFQLNLDFVKDTVLQNVGHSTKFLLGWVMAALLAPAFAFFVMRDFRRIMFRLLIIVPPDMRNQVLRMSKRIDQTLRSVLRGQILVIGSLASLYSIAFFMCGLPAGILVGIVTGLVRVVPYMDLVVGGSVTFLIMASNAAPSSMYMAVLISFAVIQLLDGLVLTPRIMGSVSGLHPFLIILAVLCFGDWFGFYGVLAAIPLAAMGRVILQTAMLNYRSSDFYKNLDC
jgi:predicted PurR-regulated permease PerM